MRIGVTHKLFLAILAAAGLAVVCSALIMQWKVDRGFLKYVNAMEQSGVSRLAVRLEERYQAEQNWDFLVRNPASWRQLVANAMPEAALPPAVKPAVPPPERRMPVSPPGERMADGSPADNRMAASHPGERPGAARPGPRPQLPPRQFFERLFLLNADKKVMAGNSAVPADQAATPLIYQGKIVGFLGLLPRTHISEAPQQRFLAEQKLAFALTAAAVVFLSALLSFILARRLVRPLGELAQATHQLAAGSFTVRVPATSGDELGQLANDFNALALALEKSEQTRRQWIADISHELRTPLAILRSEIEALQDGIRLPSPDSINSLHHEALRLGRLVDDLYQLSLSDIGALTYRKTELNLADILAETLAAYRPEFSAKGISLDIDRPEKGPATVFGDAERLHQLFGNLFDNALKYTDADGRLHLALQSSAGRMTVDFMDSSPGVPAAALDRLFERLYRVDSSRNRASGGAGLGLAICRNIAEAHGGEITARHSPLGGLWIKVELPQDASRT